MEHRAVRLLTLHIDEPLAGRVLPLMADEHGHEEAARRYRAIVVTTLRQLRGLDDVRLRILTHPDDAAEAVRFWLLPRLADRWHAAASLFQTDGWEIVFGGEESVGSIIATGEILCPFMGARWVHTAMVGLERGTHRVIGPASGGGEYFRAQAGSADGVLNEQWLPELPIIHSEEPWQHALASPLGPALRRAWEEEA